MFLKRLTHYLLKHRTQALLITFLITFLPIAGVLGIVIATLFTLVHGIIEGAFFAIAATLPYAISFFISGSKAATIPLVVWAAVGVAIVSNVLTYCFAILLRQGASWSTIIQVAALLGVLVVSVIHLIYPDVAVWWKRELAAYLEATKGLLIINKSSSSADLQLKAIDVTKDYATGLMSAAILFNAIMQLIIARWWQVFIFKPKTLANELHTIRLNHWTGIFFVASLICLYLGNSVVVDIMPIEYLLFAGAGLSLVHYCFALVRSATKWFWLILFYFIFLVSLPVSVIIVSMLALLDIFFDVRKRLKKI